MAKRTVTVAALGVLLLSTTACGGNAASAGPHPEGATTSAAASPSPTSTPTHTRKPKPHRPPLSRFENRAPVKAARALSAAVARAVNAGQRSLGPADRYMTRHGQHVMPQYAAEDAGRYFPGPNPFTPVGVQVHGKKATVPACWQSGGWSQNRKTKLPAERRTIDPVNITLRKVGGTWKVDDLLWRKGGSCAQVPVRGVAW